MKTNKITIGLDLSLTHTGFAVINEQGCVLGSGVIKSKPCGDKPIDETRRILNIVRQVMDVIDEKLPKNVSPDMVIIEGLAFLAVGTSLVQLAGMNYLLRFCLLDLEWPFLIVAPTTLKKFITGSGKGEKDQMMMSVYKNYGFEASDNNENDGYCLAVCGMAVLGKPLKELTKPQVEVIKLLEKQL